MASSRASAPTPASRRLPADACQPTPASQRLPADACQPTPGRKVNRPLQAITGPAVPLSALRPIAQRPADRNRQSPVPPG
jgi:hypothetical protein